LNANRPRRRTPAAAGIAGANTRLQYAKNALRFLDSQAHHAWR